MLSHLRIKNFALIDQLELDLGWGLNVLTGETGAGKSIILDAIDMVLGGKINSRVIRQGADRALIEATFVANPALTEWLKQQEIDPLEETSVVFSREISLTKDSLRSRSRVNGMLINQHSIAQIRERMVEITAQGQTVQLLIPEQQRNLLDVYAGEPLLSQRLCVANAYQLCQNLASNIAKYRQSEQERAQRLDFLHYQIQELDSANLTTSNEIELLEVERDRLSHIVELQHLGYKAYQILYQNDNDQPAVADLLGDTENFLNTMVVYDKTLEGVLEMIKSAFTQIVEAGHELNSYTNSLETEPERLTEIAERIRLLKQICRKYGPTLTEAIATYDKLQKELNDLDQSGESIEKLEQEYESASLNLKQAYEQLTKLRQQAANKLEKQLIAQLQPLAMDKVRFECRLVPCDICAAGAEQIVYYFSPNPGEKLQPLASTASGGEMSRFLLALKACFSSAPQGASTLIFDEIDAGVSGKVAQAIAEKLHQLSQKHQILCVTHQPLVAAMADNHFRVEKHTIEEEQQQRTVIRVNILDDLATRIDELAQLTGGNSAQEAIAFADSLLAKAAVHKN